MSADDMKAAFDEMVKLSGETYSDITIDESNKRRIDLTDIDTKKAFSIKISAEDYNGNTINIDKTFRSFSDALSDTTVKKYIKGSYYIDLGNLRNGTVYITYGI